MIKYVFTTAVAMASAIAIMASPLTPDQALQRLNGNTSLKVASRNAALLKLVHTVTAQSGIPAMYVFNYTTDKGYVILSADDSAVPMLGYADNGSFEISEIPPQMEWWLSQYADEIAGASSSAAYTTRTETREAISPLVKTKWDQSAPYNNLCPKISSTACPTGCVATAMSQVMKYWNYPANGTGYGTITLPTGATGDQTMNLRTTKFDWDNMLDSYTGNYTTDQATAVATLMKATGYATNMSYSLSGSGALAMNAAMAFSKNFSYNSNIQYLQRKYFRATDWENIIYNELAAGRPVMYGGQSTSVGHEFVCDGYDGNGYYHFNWGWSGISDGYFQLNALNPDAVGIGGGEGGGYNNTQDIIIGVQPTSENVMAYLSQWGSLTGSLSGTKLSLTANYNDATGYWINTGITELKVNIGVEFQSEDGETTVYQSIGSNVTIAALQVSGNQVQYGYTAGRASLTVPSDLADGKYKVTVCYQNIADSNPTWNPVCTTEGAYNYIYLTKSGSSYSVENMAETEITISSAEIASGLYYNNASRIKLELSNTSELEMTGSFYPVLLSGTNPVMLGEGVTETLLPGETKTIEFSTWFELLANASAPTRVSGTPYTLRFIKDTSSTDESNYYNYSTSVSMKILSATTDVKVNELKVKDAPVKQVDVAGTTQSVYVANDASSIPMSANITNNGVFFGKIVYAMIFNGDLSGGNISYCVMGPTPALDQNQSFDLSGTLDFQEADVNTPYAASMYYYGDKGWTMMPVENNLIYFLIDPTSGVKDVTAETEELTFNRADKTVTANGAYVSLEVYDLNGIRIAEANGNEYLAVEIPYANGIVIAVARKSNGEIKTLKIRN